MRVPGTVSARLLVGLALQVAAWPAPASAQETQSLMKRERVVLERAARLESAGREDESLEVLETWLEEVPTSASALVAMARVAERRGDPGRVIRFAERAVADDRTGLPVVRQLWIRALADAGYPDSARAVARRWVESQPRELAAHSELAALYARGGDTEGAISVLLAGREAMASERVFVQELALMWTDVGRYTKAAGEWRTMLSWGEPGVDVVHRQITEVARDKTGAVAAARHSVEQSAPEGVAWDGALGLALRLGEHEWARQLVADRLGQLSGQAAADLLEAYVAQARPAGDALGAAWAARNLASRLPAGSQADYWRTVGAELSLEAGDREEASRAFEEIRKRSAGGEDAHRRALRRLHELQVSADPGRAEELLAEYQSVYPGDDVTVISMFLATAGSWISLGDTDRGKRLLSGVHPTGPTEVGRQAELLGRIALLEGDPAAARPYLEQAASVPTLDAAATMRAVRWLSLLERADPGRVGRLGVAVRKTALGDPEEILRLVDGWTSGDDASALCATAARELEETGFADEAMLVRRRIVDRWPDSAEVPGALLDLARAAADSDPAGAMRWLERLIIEHPNSALAPMARREAGRLEERVSGE